MRIGTTMLASLTLLAHPAIAQSGSGTGDDTIEEVLVIAEPDTRIYELAETLDVTPDSAQLLKHAVGANVITNGPISGMAQYRGMSRMRISSRINGQVISPGGPNWMDAPLSYAPAAHLESLEVHRGIASVAAGMETIGGVIDAKTWQGEFAQDGTRVQGRVRAGAHSVNDASLLSGAFVVANRHHRLKLSGLTEGADDAEFPRGTIRPTEYERDRYDVGYGFRTGAHQFQIDYGRNETGDAGTPALPMDIAFVDSDLFGFGYGFDGDHWRLDGRLWASTIDHGMSNYHLRPPPESPAMFRRNVTDVDNLGFSVAVTVGAWRFGLDGHDEVHNSDIDNPNNPLFFVTNFNDAERRLLGAFVEREWALGSGWDLQLGARYNQVESDANEVDATPAVMGIAPAVVLRDTFNDSDRSRTDNNLDLVAKLRVDVSDRVDFYLGAARKTRAPSYQERYLWLPLQATAGLADGRTYTGNPDLDSEVAREIELGFDITTPWLKMDPRIFYKDVNDYIQGAPSTDPAAVAFVRMMNAMNGTSAPDPLEFQNLDAELYGIDVEWQVALGERWSVSGVLNYVRGQGRHDNLYRVAPLNGFVALAYDAPRWGITAEGLFADRQNKVSAVNGETETPGYALLNLKGYWRVTDVVRLSAGVDNVTDRLYRDHLGGVNRVVNPDIAVGERLPGYGRNVFARFDLTF